MKDGAVVKDLRAGTPQPHGSADLDATIAYANG
jgi:hypothetical protein